MAHHKSALKRVRQTSKRTAHNRSMQADLRTNIKKFRLLQESGNLEQARDDYPNAVSYTHLTLPTIYSV